MKQSFKTLIYNGHYVDINRLNSGIYQSDKPHLFNSNATKQSLLDDYFVDKFSNKDFTHNLNECELVDILVLQDFKQCVIAHKIIGVVYTGINWGDGEVDILGYIENIIPPDPFVIIKDDNKWFIGTENVTKYNYNKIKDYCDSIFLRISDEPKMIFS